MPSIPSGDSMVDRRRPGLVVCDLAALLFEDASFDLVVSTLLGAGPARSR